jgi:uncharacterized protein (DUF983 family)
MPMDLPGLPRMLGRALLLRCPRCGGSRAFVRRWFSKRDRCPTCGIRWRREEGSELGALTVNTILTFGALTIGMVIGFVTTWPDIAVLPLVVGLGAIAVVMPIAIYPLTYTVWLAFDLRVHPPDPAELADAALGTAGEAGAAGEPPVLDAGA